MPRFARLPTAASTLVLALVVAACGGAQEAELTSAAKAEIAETAVEIASSEDVNAVYGEFLETYITETDGINFIAYGEVSEEDHQSLKAYIAALESQGVEGLPDEEAMAYWFNLYNAATIDVILDNYPLSSIRSLGPLNSGPWDRKVLNVSGVGEMSLNDVEHGTLRATWEEPRIHYAVNCASFGCPNLMDRPWEAETLEEDLEAAAIAYVNHPRGVRVEDGKVTASKIYNWYKEDFGGDQTGILEHARQYAEGDLATALADATRIDSFEYDWDLNEG
ncbi:MAG: DUF547 domain-containing protein [Pseudomonadota bacterium]